VKQLLVKGMYPVKLLQCCVQGHNTQCMFRMGVG